MSTLPTYILNTALTASQLKDAIVERIQKLKSLAYVCQAEDFTEFSLENISGYFWLQSSLLEELSELFMAFNQHHLLEPQRLSVSAELY